MANMANFTRMMRGILGVLLFGALLSIFQPIEARSLNMLRADVKTRDRTSLNSDWRFSRFTSNPDSLSYDKLKQWILPCANDFITGTKRSRPSGTPPGSDVNYVKSSFDDSSWESVTLPHDWAVKGPFNAPGVSGGMGRLPSNGVGWYRRKVTIAAEDIAATRSLYLDIDGAMSYAAIWLNGNLVGGWPYGYNSFRLDLTPYAKAGDNLLAIRVDNALDNSRWYPGAGIYRNVWLVKVDATHVGQYGTYITTPTVSSTSATVNLMVQVENMRSTSQKVDVVTEIYAYDALSGTAKGSAVATFPKGSATIAAGTKQSINASVAVANPQLWGPPPKQTPNLYVAVTTVTASDSGQKLDIYQTPFGIRTITYDANKGVLVNGQAVRIQGTCNHHDLGSLGSAFNLRASERQLQMLQEMGSNALRTSHNPTAPEVMDLADRLGFLVLDEIFDCWNKAKTSNDFHLIFPDWHEADLRNFIRRDRNHPSVIAWSVGNEIPEQSDSSGTSTFNELRNIARQEDPTRGATTAMNSAGTDSGIAAAVDIIGLNYQGEWGNYGSFHSKFPNKMIWGSETSSVLSTRGTYLFPVTSDNSKTVGGSDAGGDSSALQVSAYELYAPSWGSAPDRVFSAQDKASYVAGEFVWTGWDYIGEPTPYDKARSSYFGIIDMAGFKKDRFYLYQARWAPDVKMAHILPHWSWSGREGQVTPVHVFSSATEAELFVNGKSAGRIKKGQYEYRFRWDKVVYQPGDLKVVTYKNGVEWATDTKRTVGSATQLNVTSDTSSISGDKLAFITVAVTDKNGDTVPQASNSIAFSVTGPGQIVSTDNGNPADFTAFPSTTRKAFSGFALAIIRAKPDASGTITVTASSNGLSTGQVTLNVG